MAKRRKRGGGGSRTAGPVAAAAGHGAHPARAAAPARSAWRGLDRALVALAALGIALTGYLTFTAWFGERPAFCGPDSGCDLVQSSRWSSFLGMPMALWGLLTYAVLARFLWRLHDHASAWRGALVVTTVGAGVSWYLTAVSVLSIEATCAWCLASFALMNVLLVLVLLRRPAQMPEHRWARALPAPLGIAAAVVLGLHLHFSGLFDPAAGPEDPYLKALAVHLDDSGAHFYGAYWCPLCLDQKELFAASAERLPYVECTPQGRGGPISLDCENARVRNYPTWIIGGKRLTGVLDPAALARASRFRAPPDGG